MSHVKDAGSGEERLRLLARIVELCFLKRAELLRPRRSGIATVDALFLGSECDLQWRISFGINPKLVGHEDSTAIGMILGCEFGFSVKVGDPLDLLDGRKRRK